MHACDDLSMPRTSKQNNGAASKVNKSEWIRSQSSSIPAKEIVAKAKAQGISLSLAQVYTTRSNANKKPGRAARSGRPQSSAVAELRGDSETSFRRFVLTLGLDRVEAMLAQIKRSAGL